MSTTKHTPKPWKFDSSDMNVYDQKGSGIATIHRKAKIVGVDDVEKSGLSIETVANATLLESAPDLLEALEEALPILSEFSSKLFFKAQEAIKKAKQ